MLMVAAGLAYSGVFYETGSQFYDACWERSVKAKAAGGFKEPEAGSAKQATLWANCTPITARALDAAGFAFGYSGENAPKDQQTLAKYCPDAFAELPASPDYLYLTTVKTIEMAGGPSALDHLTPAEWLVERSFKARWPKCVDMARSFRGEVNRAASP